MCAVNEKIVQVLKTIKQHLNPGKGGIVIWIMLAALRLFESALRTNLWVSPHTISNMSHPGI